LRFEDLRFARSNSAVAIALAWLARGSPETSAAARAAIGEVEVFCTDTGYPQTRFGAGALAAAELLRRVGRGDIAEMGALLALAIPPVPPVARGVTRVVRATGGTSDGHRTCQDLPAVR